MAKCPTTADKCDAAGLKWFKIDAKGLLSASGDGGTWAQADLMAGKPGNATVPAGLEAGAYLLRYEILALHRAIEVGGAELYVRKGWCPSRADARAASSRARKSMWSTAAARSRATTNS